MFAITMFADVVTVAKTFGPDALAYAVGHNTLPQEACRLIADCRKMAVSKRIEVVSFNDGSTEFSVDAEFNREMLGGHYYTSLNDITIVRTGLGSFRKSAADAVNYGDLTHESLRYILKVIGDRNEAAEALGL